MKKYCRIFALLLACLLLFSACGGGAQSPASDPGETNMSDTKPAESEGSVMTPRDNSTLLNVLFIGNSFTFYNDLNRADGIFARIARVAGYQVIVSSVYRGGYYLHQFLDETDEYGEQVLQKLRSDTKYDIVIIQEQSVQSIKDPDDFRNSVSAFKDLVAQNGGELWLYSTWGFHPEHKQTAKYGPTTQEMERKIRDSYTAVGNELGIPVIYAGAAMTKSFEDNPDIELYDPDHKHPSLEGSTLVAWTIFGTVFGVDPATLTFDSFLPPDTAKCLRETASAIVLGNK